jgi:hypothetical protein
MIFRCVLDLDNAAMQEVGSLANLLDYVASQVRTYDADSYAFHPQERVRDANGNVIGSWLIDG